MNKYISRDEAINAIKSLESSLPAKDNYAKGYDAALGRVQIAVRTVPPAADVQPVKHAYWLGVGEKFSEDWTCSNCMRARGKANSSNFCSYCGADMRGDTNG